MRGGRQTLEEMKGDTELQRITELLETKVRVWAHPMLHARRAQP
jgi:hypothetical protein